MLAFLSTTTAIACGTIIASASQVQAQLINGGFELPDVGSSTGFFIENDADVPGWERMNGSSIEIWGNGFLGVTAYEGTQHAEVDQTLFQEISGIGIGQQVSFEFAHRGRVGTDVINFSITDLGIDNLFGTGDDTVLFTKNYSADTSAWVFNTNAGENPIITLGNNIRFAYFGVSTGSGDSRVGNFLDAADFGVEPGVVVSVPEPSQPLSILAIGIILGSGRLIKRKLTSN